MENTKINLIKSGEKKTIGYSQNAQAYFDEEKARNFEGRRLLD